MRFECNLSLLLNKGKELAKPIPSPSIYKREREKKKEDQGTEVQVCDPSTWKIEAGRSGVQSGPLLQSELEASLVRLKPKGSTHLLLFLVGR